MLIEIMNQHQYNFLNWLYIPKIINDLYFNEIYILAKNELNVTPDNQIVSCLSPNTYDLNDLMTASADWTVPNTPISFDTSIGSEDLNTPILSDSLLNSESIFPNSHGQETECM